MEGEQRADAWKSTVETLQRFYTVIIAIALTSSLANLVTYLDDNPHTLLDRIKVIALATALLSTIVPFYHGMERHLYETHRGTPKLGPGGKNFPLLVDVFVFIVEGGLLFTMGHNLSDPQDFLALWTLLLLVDIVWSLAVWIVQRTQAPIWARNNFVWLLIAWGAWWGISRLIALQGCDLSRATTLMAVLLAVAEIGRSVTDYILNWKFYFPDNRSPRNG